MGEVVKSPDCWLLTLLNVQSGLSKFVSSLGVCGRAKYREKAASEKEVCDTFWAPYVRNVEAR